MTPAGELNDDDRESYGITEDTVAKLKEIHGTIRAYGWYAIGAFKNFGGAEIEEMDLKFGLKIGAKVGTPRPMTSRRHQGKVTTSLDIPGSMLAELDQMARELNISREAVIKMMLRRALDEHHLAKRAAS